MILPSRAEIIGHAKNGTLLNAIFDDLWESRFQHCDALAEQLAQAQNDGDINLLSLLASGAIDAFHGYKADLGRRIYFLVLRKLDISAPALITALEGLSGQKGTETYEVTDTLSAWCGASGTRPTVGGRVAAARGLTEPSPRPRRAAGSARGASRPRPIATVVLPHGIVPRWPALTAAV